MKGTLPPWAAGNVGDGRSAASIAASVARMLGSEASSKALFAPLSLSLSLSLAWPRAMIEVKRAYDAASAADGHRVLVDRAA